LAIQKLQSSYFVQWTHMYSKWKKTKDSRTATITPAPPISTCTPCANLQSATYYS
jgi:hypothetical protein